MLTVNNKILCSHCFKELTQDSDVCRICGYDKNTYTPDAGVLPCGTILLGKYVIGKALGRGGFGITYLGYDIPNDKKVAIKEYLPDGLAYRPPNSTLVSTYQGEKAEFYSSGAERFYEEAKTVSRFNGHPNIVNVYEFFYENNTAYFVMEYIDGIDFKKYIAQNGGKIPSEKALKLLVPIMDALMIVHSTGILHRDISPDNIYVTKNDEVKLLDFGAARQVLGEESKSLSVILKQGFAPLEQYQKKGNQGPWSDIYALGATMYYAICGKIPENVMSRIEQDILERPSQLGIPIDPRFETILLRMLAVKPQDRYQSIVDLKTALNQFLAGEKIPNDGKNDDRIKADKADPVNPGPPVYPANRKNSHALAFIIPTCICALTIILFLTLVLHPKHHYGEYDETADSSGGSNVPVAAQTSPSPSPSVSKTFNMEVIENIIRGQAQIDDVAVSINDFKAKQVYNTKNAGERFNAAGFYLPIYIQAKDLIEKNSVSLSTVYCPNADVFQGGTGTLKKDQALSGEYTLSTYLTELMNMDNLAANTLIDYIGGFDKFNLLMIQNGYDSTKFNRSFGDAQAAKNGFDNYTSAENASQFLKKLNDYGDSSLLSANPDKFNITLPDGVRVNAHFGTIGDALNAYMIVQGSRSSYSIAILTKNNTAGSGGETISQILKYVQQQMDDMYSN